MACACGTEAAPSRRVPAALPRTAPSAPGRRVTTVGRKRWDPFSMRDMLEAFSGDSAGRGK